jgi:hypothetical protein
LPKYQRPFRLDIGDCHDLTWLAEIRVRREADLIANLQLLPLRDNAVSVANLRAEQILDPFVCVEATAPLPHLNEPGPDRGWRCLDRDRHRVLRDRFENNGVTR